MTRGGNAYVTIAHSDVVALVKNGQLIALASTGTPGGPGEHSPCWSAVAGPPVHVLAWATILTELFGGLAILAGAFVWAVSIPLAIVLLTAIFTVHLQYGFSSIKLIAITPDGQLRSPYLRR